jgi:hypothetical protein
MAFERLGLLGFVLAIGDRLDLGIVGQSRPGRCTRSHRVCNPSRSDKGLAPAPPRESPPSTVPSPSRRRPRPRRSPGNRPHPMGGTCAAHCSPRRRNSRRRLVRHAILKADQLPADAIAIAAVARIAKESVQRVRAKQLEEIGAFRSRGSIESAVRFGSARCWPMPETSLGASVARLSHTRAIALAQIGVEGGERASMKYTTPASCAPGPSVEGTICDTIASISAATGLLRSLR